ILTALMVPMVALNANAASADSSKTTTGSKPTTSTITVYADINCKDFIEDANEFGYLAYDLYEITFTDQQLKDFSAIALGTKDGNLKEEYAKIAQDIIIKVKDGTAGSPVNSTPLKLGEKVKLDAATYVLVAKGVADPTKPFSEGQVKTSYEEVAKTSANPNVAEKSIASHIRIGANYFTVSPQLITAPMKVNANGQPVTFESDEGKWLDHQDIYLKMLADPEYGSIIINKTILDYVDQMENVTCVFQVDIIYPYDENQPVEGQTMYSSESYGITFFKDTKYTEQLKIDGIPLKAHVTVNEVYSGGSYSADIKYPGASVVLDIGNSEETINFKNTPTGRKGGGGITNRSSFDEGEGDKITWKWEQLPNGNIKSTNGRVREAIKEYLPNVVENTEIKEEAPTT
ncbi:MAG: hypothetical protein HUJ70_14695, partial [Pseudobutyrivibrio sp.]|nr:hypothetical protein [Pseudobutyrivibrio sp.]